jgi:radical SAM protein with 4Fe4S-binding SPASM domain
MLEDPMKILRERTSLKYVGTATITELFKRAFNIPMKKIDARLLPLRTLSTPCVLQLEPTNKCNLKCGMCHRNFMLPSKIGELEFDNFRKIVDPLLPYLEGVWLQGEGEPFLCKDIFKMIRYLRRKSIYVNTVTNATLLKREACERILASGLDEISISIDGATAETYEKIRTGASFEQVTENMQTLTSLAREGSHNHIKIVAFAVAMIDNVHEMPALIDLIHKFGIEYLWMQDVQFQQLNAGLAKKEKSLRVLAEQDAMQRKEIEEHLKKASRLARKYNIQMLTYGGKSVFDRLYISRSRQICSWPWTGVYVTWDGFVSPCCIPSTYFCGNLFQEPFHRIWNNDRYRDFRRRLKSGKLPYQCTNCSFL